MSVERKEHVTIVSVFLRDGENPVAQRGAGKQRMQDRRSFSDHGQAVVPASRDRAHIMQIWRNVCLAVITGPPRDDNPVRAQGATVVGLGGDGRHEGLSHMTCRVPDGERAANFPPTGIKGRVTGWTDGTGLFSQQRQKCFVFDPDTRKTTTVQPNGCGFGGQRTWYLTTKPLYRLDNASR